MIAVNHSDNFCTARELSVSELDEVNGGIPFVVAGVLAFYSAEIAYGVGFVAGAATAAYAYANG